MVSLLLAPEDAALEAWDFSLLDASVVAEAALAGADAVLADP